MKPIQVLYHDQHIVAVHKTAGTSVHNNEDLQNLLSLLEQQLHVPKLFPVHRLDKETSGVQILALSSTSARTLAEEFQKRTVQKIYVGVVRGQLKSATGIWTQPLTDKAEGRKNPEGTRRDRIPCETKFKVLRQNAYFSLCEFDLLTGRQHQIRKHTALAHHHLVGDPRYGDPKYNAKVAHIYKSDRMYLHCQQIRFLDHLIECPSAKDFELLVPSDDILHTGKAPGTL